jgi:putative chitinase
MVMLLSTELLNNFTLSQQPAIKSIFNCLPSTILNSQIAYILATAEFEPDVPFKPGVESLNYTTTERLMKVWPTRFRTAEQAKTYLNSPQKLANYVYGGRMGNNYISDGWNFRGRGFVQVTGRNNYQRFATLLDQDLINKPDLACSLDIAAQILVQGMLEGCFTGQRLDKFINKDNISFYHAREVVNGDLELNGQKIAGIAERYNSLLQNP